MDRSCPLALEWGHGDILRRAMRMCRALRRVAVGKIGYMNEATSLRLFSAIPALAALVILGAFTATRQDQAAVTLAAAPAAQGPAIAAPGTLQRVAIAVASAQSVTNRYVHFEVYNAAGKRVWQAWRSPITLLHGSTRLVATWWPVPRAQAPGTYTLKASVFAATGALQAQDSHAGAVTVGR